jgi:hypothetical protein
VVLFAVVVFVPGFAFSSLDVQLSRPALFFVVDNGGFEGRLRQVSNDVAMHTRYVNREA